MAIVLTQDKDFFPQSLTEKFSYLNELGFDGFEIDGKLLLHHFGEVQSAIQTTGFPVLSACGGYTGWIGDFDEGRRQQALKDISLILQRLSQLGGKGIVVPAAWGMFSLRLPPMVPPRTAAEDERVLLHSLAVLNDAAATHNVSVFLEPLNRYEDHMINTLERGACYIEQGGFTNVSLTADFYHMNIEEAKIGESLFRFKRHIGHVHLADSHRYQPGTGHTDFEEGCNALRKMNYGGMFAVECRVLGKEPAIAYARSLQHIRKFLSGL